ncbi:hypothetical protein F0P96_10650 [Hymenobacter busanensis]|uniref:Uncharacterized protein n=1 Tax=Hymenobacter busanensis TaxID=2607656 RepID=A0A7L5A2B1_9BACT|nr:hypothetical protein [Hymenobacter busanensis]KAA9333420.1 hypothetical protein F0P96_10650 [Hymenobacter busanensis]QHJ07900.1 hypothetical protein GUY19_11655 [Hymenobacter busanensis]
MRFTLRNFYHPAPRQVQRVAAALKGISGIVTLSALASEYKWLAGGGLLLAIVAETMEKLSGDPDTPAPPKDDTPNAPE